MGGPHVRTDQRDAVARGMMAASPRDAGGGGGGSFGRQSWYLKYEDGRRRRVRGARAKSKKSELGRGEGQGRQDNGDAPLRSILCIGKDFCRWIRSDEVLDAKVLGLARRRSSVRVRAPSDRLRVVQLLGLVEIGALALIRQLLCRWLRGRHCWGERDGSWGAQIERRRWPLRRSRPVDRAWTETRSRGLAVRTGERRKVESL